MTNSATTRGWGKPGTQKIRNATGGGVEVPVAKEVAPIFSDLFEQLNSRGYNLAGYADDWGVCFRPVRGYEDEWRRTKNEKYLSNHSWGLAVDLDATENPMTSSKTARHEFKAQVVDPILERYKGKLIWGGEYGGSRKDYMHFEFIGTPKDAAAVVASLQQKPGLPTESDEDMTKEEHDRLVNVEKMLQQLTAPRRQDKADIDPNHLSLADIYTLIEK